MNIDWSKLTFSGLMLERYFKEMYIEAGRYTDIGGFWDRKGENEIDLIAGYVVEQENPLKDS